MLCVVARFEEQILRWELPQTEARLGSSSDNDFVLPFPGVSRQHAKVEINEGRLKLVDLGSKNGILLGGKRVAESILEPGVAVQIGKAFMSVEEADTSEVELAIHLSSREGRGERATEGDSSGDGKDGPVAALRFIREHERKGEKFSGRRRQMFVAGARDVLDATLVALVHLHESGELSVLNLAGAGWADPLDRVLSASPTARRKTVATRVVSTAEGDAFIARKGTHAVVAQLSRGAAASGWVRDFFGYVAERLLREAVDEPPREDQTHVGELVLPPDMVLGPSDSMNRLLKQIAATVSSRMNVVLLGETGTGKELFAKMMHISAPSSGPFVAINCAAIPGELLESELFGVQGRVATGVDPRQGLFVQADGGTILLDEISELPDRLQAKLLRVLQEREVLAIGASAPKKIDVRVIAASNRNLSELVDQGKFRKDLFYRLRGLQFHIPPLRDRADDIPALVIEFVSRAASEYRKNVRGVSRAALRLLCEHDWPGNVRELESEIRRAVLVCPEGGAIHPEHLGTVRWEVERARGEAATHGDLISRAATDPRSEEANHRDGAERAEADARWVLQSRMDAVERRAIEEALREARGNRSRAARMLGITRNGLAMKMTRLGLTPAKKYP